MCVYSGLIPNSILRGQFDYVPPEDKALEAVLGTRLRESEIWEKMNQLQLTPQPSSESGDIALDASNGEIAEAIKNEHSDSGDSENEVGARASELPQLSQRSSSAGGHTLPSEEESERHTSPPHSSGTSQAPARESGEGTQQLPRERQESSGDGSRERQPALSKSSSRKVASDTHGTSIPRKKSKL